MPKSPPNVHGEKQGLERSPYFALLGGVVAATMLFAIPFYPKYLVLAAAMGAISFAIHWLEIRRRTRFYFQFITFFGCVFSQQVGNAVAVPARNQLRIAQNLYA
jgi:hypothetical protein